MINKLILQVSKADCIRACAAHAQCKAINFRKGHPFAEFGGHSKPICVGMSQQCTMSVHGSFCHDTWWCGYNILSEEEVVGLSETIQPYSEINSVSIFSYVWWILAAIGALALVYAAFKLCYRKKAYYPVLTQEYAQENEEI